MKKSFVFFVAASLFAVFLHGKESLFLMPRDAKPALKMLTDDLENAKKSIKVSIYSFTHKSLAKSLKKAASRGVKITILFDHDQNSGDSYSRLGDLAKIRNIDAYTIQGIQDKKKGYYGKMHLKVVIIDEEKIYFGSANWSYSAFSKNYELLYATDSREIIDQYSRFFETMRQAAHPFYR